MSKDFFRAWIITPLDHLAWSNREISPVEERDYLYRQELALEKLCSTWQDTNRILEDVVDMRKAEMISIINSNEYDPYERQAMIDSMWDINGWIYEMASELSDISEMIWRSYRMNYSWFKNVIKWLWLINKNLSDIDNSIWECSRSLISSVEHLSDINQKVLSSLWRIDNKLWNPRKTAWLEHKRDWFEYYKKWWHDEAFKLLYEALNCLPADYEIYYLLWLMHLEEKREYEKSKFAFEKASFISKSQDEKIYLSSLKKLAITNFIIWNYREAFNCQNEVINHNPSPMDWLNLARFSAYLDIRDTFAHSVERAIREDRFLLVKFTTENDFINSQWKIEIIQWILDKVKHEEIRQKVENKEVSAIKDIIENNYDVNQFLDSSNTTPLHFLAKLISCDPSHIYILLEKWAQIEARDLSWATPLHTASKNRNKEMLSILIEKGANIEAKDEAGRTPMHSASIGYAENLRILIEKGAYMESQENAWRTPLHLACCHGASSENIKLLLENGAKVNAVNKFLQTPLHLACLNSDTRISKLLLEGNAFIGARDWNWHTPLFLACRNKDEKLIKLLLEKGADANETIQGQTPLHMLIWEEGAYHIIDILLKSWADKEKKNKEWFAPLHIACKAWNMWIIELLVKQGAKVNVKDNNWNTPMHCIQSFQPKFYEFLIRNNASYLAKNNEGLSVFDMVMKKEKNIIKFLRILEETNKFILPEWADIKLINLAINNQDADLLRVLADNKVNLNRKGPDWIYFISKAYSQPKGAKLLKVFVNAGVPANVPYWSDQWLLIDIIFSNLPFKSESPDAKFKLFSKIYDSLSDNDKSEFIKKARSAYSNFPKELIKRIDDLFQITESDKYWSFFAKVSRLLNSSS